MKNKKILGGLVVVAVLLSGTTFLYFAGVERAGPTPVLAGDPDDPAVGPPCGEGGCGGCIAAGGFCAVSVGTGGGCTPRLCCGEAQTSCGPTALARPLSFRQLGSPPSGSCGTCWYYPADATPKLWCVYSDCTGSACPSACSVHPLTQGNPQFSVEAVGLSASCELNAIPCD